MGSRDYRLGRYRRGHPCLPGHRGGVPWLHRRHLGPAPPVGDRAVRHPHRGPGLVFVHGGAVGHVLQVRHRPACRIALEPISTGASTRGLTRLHPRPAEADPMTSTPAAPPTLAGAVPRRAAKIAGWSVMSAFALLLFVYASQYLTFNPDSYVEPQKPVF